MRINHHFWYVSAITLVSTFTGCAQGPFPELAGWNPYLRKQWEADEAHGPTVYQQIARLQALRDSAPDMDPSRQQQTAMHMIDLLQQSENSLLRIEAAGVLGGVAHPAAAQGLQLALEDDDPDVRIAACRAVASRGGNDAVLPLSSVAASDPNQDVRMAAISALGEFSGDQAVGALALALDDGDPALQHRAMKSLQKSTGQNIGDSVAAWRAYVRGEQLPQDAQPTIVDRMRNLF